MIGCRVCNTSALQVYDEFKPQGSSEKITLYCCTQCKTFFINPVPYDYQSQDDLISYYLPIKDSLMQRYDSVFKYVNYLGKTGKFLDIGCGIGYSLLVAKKWEWEALGIEPNPYLVRYSRSQFNLNIINDFFDAKNFSRHSFDFIILDQVLEHLYNVHPFFEDVISLLKPGGVLMIGVPPVDWLRLWIAQQDPYIGKSNLPLKLFKNMSPNFRIFYDLEQHVNYFTYSSMLSMVSLQGDLILLPKFHHSKIRNLICKVFRLSTGYFFVEKVK